MADHKKRNKDDRRAERRQELLDAAVVTIRRDGAGVSMEDIAHEAGITKPILYANFGDKAGLADALAKRFTRDLIARFGEVWATSDDTRERVRLAIEAWVAFIESDPHIYRFLSEGSFGAGRRLEDRRLVSDVGVVVARALGEFGAVLVVGGAISGRTQTATTFIYNAVEERQEAAAYGMALVLALISILLLVVLEWVKRRRAREH